MGIFSNTVSICHFRVAGELIQSDNRHFFDFAHELLEKQSFNPIDDSTEELSLGWVHTDDPKEHGFENPSACWRDSYLMFSLRRDQRKVPTALLKEHVDKACEQFLSENPNFSRVPKQKKVELKEQVKLQLLAKTLPDPKVYDAVWDTEKGIVTFTTLSPKTIEIFEDLFKRTFEGLRLQAFIPYHRAEIVTPSVYDLQAANRAAGDSYLELMNKNQWIGSDFMFWLLYQTLNGAAEYRVNQPGPCLDGEPFIGYVDDRVVLVGEGENGTQMITVNGPQDRFREVKSALLGNKRISESTVHLETQDSKWCLTLKGSNFHFASFSTPAVKLESDSTTDERLEREAVFFERMLLLDKGLQLFDSLFARFLSIRLASEWGDVAAKIQTWLEEG